MTITDNGRVEVDEEMLARGRELVADGRMPSKRQLQKHLRTSWPNVNAVLLKLGEETAAATLERRRQARAAMRRLTSRKRSAAARVIHRDRFPTVNEIPAPTALEPVVEPPAAPAPEAVREHPGPVVAPVNESPAPRPFVRTWPAWIVASPAFVAIWAGWVGIGKLTGFGKVNLLPGIGKGWVIDTAITLPIGVEAYAGYAFYVALHRYAPRRARRFAAWSAGVAVLLGMGGQTAYHLMSAERMTAAPWQITTIVSCLPVAVFGLAAALVHMVRAGEEGAR